MVTVPITVLQREEITFTPPLPQLKQQAIQRVKMSNAIKVRLAVVGVAHAAAAGVCAWMYGWDLYVFMRNKSSLAALVLCLQFLRLHAITLWPQATSVHVPEALQTISSPAVCDNQANLLCSAAAVH